ncbi:MAG: M81 family metallopeptidase [Gemmatimonadota bacterium]|nr:M81 family metallopeptidase [Gemmatimonadota bacterium]
MPASTPSDIPGKAGAADQISIRKTTFREENMLRILVGAYFQETNDFHPNNTEFEDFSIRAGDDLIDETEGVMGGALNIFSQRSDVEVVPSYGATMGAGGTITHSCFEHVTSELLEAIERNKDGIDGVYLNMHGAMAAEIEKDPEGYVLQEVRRIMGPGVPIVPSFDMHGTITRRMLQNMDAATILHTYPHIDWYETGERAATVLLRILDGAKPVMASVYTPTMVRGDELKTATGVHGTFIRHLERLEERDDVLAGGIMLGHPPTDCPEQGSRCLVITDNNRDLAEQEALRIAQNFWDMRERMQCVLYSVEDAIETAKKANGAVILSDAADATSSGAPGTSNTILKGFLETDYKGKVLFPIRDEPAVESAVAAGVGQTITVPLGGTKDPRFSPVDVTGTVEVLGRRDQVRIAVLQADNITIFMATEGGTLCDRWMYSDFGQDPKSFDVIIQKLPHTPYEWYDEWAERNMTIDVPGAASPNIPTLGHQYVPRPIYPLDPDMTYEPYVEVY